MLCFGVSIGHPGTRRNDEPFLVLLLGAHDGGEVGIAVSIHGCGHGNKDKSRVLNYGL